MKRTIHTLAYLFTVCLIGWNVHAEFLRDIYFTTNLGISTTAKFDYLGSTTDQGSVCDPFINPSEESRQIAGCPTEGTGWLTKFGSASGVASTFLLGRNFGGTEQQNRFSAELELAYRNSSIDQTQSLRSRTGVARDKLSNEIYRAAEHIGTITTQTVFTNLRYNFRYRARVKPYIGAGIGLAQTSIYGGRIWVRNNDWTQISTGSSLPNSEEVRRNLAATTSTVHETLTDNTLSVQVFAGLNFELNDTTLLGLHGNFTQIDSFEATGTLDVLRSHEVPSNYFSTRTTNSLRYMGIGLRLTVLL